MFYCLFALSMPYLLFRYVDWLVQHNPGDGLVAGWSRCRAIVRHVVVRVGQQSAYGEPLHKDLIATVTNALQLVGQHAQLGIGEVAQLADSQLIRSSASGNSQFSCQDSPAVEWRRRRCPGPGSVRLRNLRRAGSCNRIFVSAMASRKGLNTAYAVYADIRRYLGMTVV